MTDSSKLGIARASFEPMVAAAGQDGRKLVALATLAAKIGLGERVYALALQARACAPDDPEIAARSQQLIAQQVPRWHFHMLRDTARNAAFEAAIDRAVQPGMHVLDIGAGSGLLSMMAARARAGRVVACEENPAIADAATRVVAANGYDGHIRIVTGNSTKLDVEADLEGRADLIVSEIVSTNLLAEGVLETLSDAATRLLAPGGRMIPSGGDVLIALGTWTPAEDPPIAAIAGFDLRQFEALAPVPQTIRPGSTGLTLLSDAVPLLSFDFTAPAPCAPHRTRAVLTATGGPVAGVVQWIGLQLDAEGRYENRPGPEAKSHWGVHFYPFDAPLDVVPGAEVHVSGLHDGKRLTIWADPARASAG